MASIEFATWPNTAELCFGNTPFSKPDLLKYLNSHGVVVSALEMLHEVPDASQKIFMVVFKSSSEHQLFMSKHGRKQTIKVRGQDLVVSCSDKSLNYKRVRICKLPPVVNLGIVKTRLGSYGKIEGEPEWEIYRNFPERKDLKTGWLIVNMTIDHHIPSYVNIGPYRCLVIYENQPKTCRQCDSPDHIWAKCPIVQERFNKRTYKPTLNEHSTYQPGGDGNAGGGPKPPPPPTKPPQPTTTPEPAPQPAPVAPPPALQEAPVHTLSQESNTAADIAEGNEERPSETAEVSSAAIPAVKPSWKKQAMKTKPNLNRATRSSTVRKQGKNPPEKRSASVANLPTESKQETTRARTNSGPIAQSVNASIPNPEVLCSTPVAAIVTNDARDDIVMIEETQFSSISFSRISSSGSGVVPSIIDITQSPRNPRTKSGNGAQKSN
jgi:hypothetical protein